MLIDHNSVYYIRYDENKRTTQVIDLLSHLFNVLLGLLDGICIWTQTLQLQQSLLIKKVTIFKRKEERKPAPQTAASVLNLEKTLSKKEMET